MRQIKIQHWIILFFLPLLTWSGCNVEEIDRGNGTPLPAGVTRLVATVRQGVQTRAVGDRLNDATINEKRVDRLAFFVHTDEDGLQIYPPAPDDGSTTIDDDPNSVHLAETAPDSRQYTADVVLTAGGGYMADIVAVANLPEDYDYRQIVSWDGLQDSVLVWATANMLPATVGNALEMPSCNPGTNNKIDDTDRRAFAMYGYTRHELVKEESNTFTLAMERLAARIDITNEAYVKGMTDDDPKGGFRLSSVRLLHTRPASYITPQADYTSPDVVTVSDWQVTDIPYGKEAIPDPDTNPTGEPDKVEAADAEASATLQYLWRTLYTYENSDTEHAPTALEIKGTFRGTEITRRIPFVNKDGAAFPVEGNHRYLVRIMKAPGQTDISFNIAVSEWDAVDTVNVKPDQTEVPVITNLATNLTEYTNSEGQKAYDLFYTQNGEMTFEATCRFAAGVRIKYYDEKSETWTTQGNWLKVEQVGEAEVTTKANNAYKISYKITCDKFDGGRTRKAMLLVHNGGSEVECDTMIIRHVITYPGTDLEGIEVEDPTGAASTVTWAPVNVGATRIATDIKPGYDYDTRQPIPLSEEDQQSNFEQCGYLFQWGRKTPFKFPGCDEMMKNTIEFSTLDEFPTYEEGISPDYEYYDKYIIRNSSVNYYYWYKDHGFNSAPLSPILANKMLWPRQSDPCPVGWHVPSNEDSQSLINMLNSDGTASNHWIVQSSTIANLVFPHAGRIHVYGEGRFMSDSGVYWLSTVKADEISPPILAFSFNSAKLVNVGWALCFSTTAIPVRCVQDPIP